MVTTFAPVYTATKWTSIVDAMQSKARKLTNADAVSVIEQWQLVARDDAKVAWQFAAHAYGWDPPRTVQMTNSAAQAAKPYPLANAMWMWARGVATDLDEHRSDADPPPRIAVNRDTFASPTFYGQVRAELEQDGLLKLKTKVPLPTCVDTKTGKRRFPRPGDTKDTCRPDLVDDPITAASNSFWSLAFMLGALWLVTRD